MSSRAANPSLNTDARRRAFAARRSPVGLFLLASRRIHERDVPYLLGLLLLILSVDLRAANDPQLVMEEFMVPAVDRGISLYVRNKHPQGVSNFSGEKILLYVHGATYPSETAFDLRLKKK
jgi:hypothetical protein